MRKFVVLAVLVAWCIVAVPVTASAKDKDLVQAMADFDKAYIPPMFFTSSNSKPLSVKSMAICKSEWEKFTGAYYDYRPNYANWQSYFVTINEAVAEADVIVTSCALNPSCTDVVPAHEPLELVRLTMRELRTHNGFPKFNTDALTAFHEPMEAIVLTVKGKTPDMIDEATIAALYAHLDEAFFLWRKVEKCPLDPELWHFTDQQVTDYYTYLFQERLALTTFKDALDSGNKLAIIQTGVGVKPTFVKAYTLFGDFARVMRP
ncbi:MAG: hypothetical protein A2X58_00775 [Nitrospirae bacterium GWC2_56_14]|nr:MAG: hypothetical protein A2X58_00775 [Nitrospirae bacterium GWC2_56_14]